VNVVDSSAWLEYFGGGKNAAKFRQSIHDTESLVVPTVVVYEVFKRILQQVGPDEALRAVAVMRNATVIDLDADLAVAAAELSSELQIPMADSIILATARRFGATVWTQDADFDGLPDVKYWPASRIVRTMSRIAGI